MKPTTANNQVRAFSSLQYAYREMFDGRLIVMSLSVLGVSVFAFGILGPLGFEDGFQPMKRVAFVAACGAICWPLAHPVNAAILFVMRSRPPVQIVLASTLGALFVTIPCSAVSYTLYKLFQSDDPVHVAVLDVYPSVATMVLACTCLVHYVACQRARLRRATETGHASSRDDEGARDAPLTETQPAAAPQSWFFDRLPAMVGRDVVFLNVCGHYINVVTTAGSCLVLMRFADAMAALGDLGLQVHRSYWVAHRHILGVFRRDERTLVRVTGPHEIPVSRTHLTAVRAAVPPAEEQRSPL